MQAKFITWARGAYLAGLVLALIFIIPFSWFPLQLGKVAIFSGLLLIAAVLWALGGGAGRLLRGEGFYSALLVVLLPVVYLVSWYLSTDPSLGFSGYAVEGDTVVFIVLSFLAFLFAFALFRGTRGARLLLYSVAGAAALAVLFQYVVILFGLPLSIFSDHSVNLVGKWNDLGLLAGLLAFLLVAWIEFGAGSLLRRVIAGLCVLALLLLLALVQFSLAWELVLGFSILIAGTSLIASRSGDSLLPSLRSAPWVPLVVALVSALFLVWGATFNSRLTNVFPVSSLEVRPGFSATLGVIKSAHSDSLERFFVGSGPNTFGDSWLLYKPSSVNQSQFWNLNFAVGFSTFLTALGSVGLLGALAWLLPLVFVLLGLLRALRSAAFSSGDKMLALGLGLSGLYVWGAVLFYVPSQNLMLLAFTLMGAALGFSMRAPAAPEVADPSPRIGRLGYALCALVLLIVLGGVTYITVRRAVAEAYTNAGAVALTAGDADQALAFASRAQTIEKTDDDLRLSVDAGGAKLQALASASSALSADVQQQFVALAQASITDVQQALVLAPQDYRTYLSLGNLYALLSSLSIQGAAQSAQAAYSASAVRSPLDPEIPLALSRLAAAAGDASSTTAYLSKALQLKPDYTDAILFVVQLDVAQNDLASAVKAAQAAVQSAPGVPSIWFELGLLYYEGGDAKDAAVALGQALKLEPNYANAQYFLGLSQAALGDTAAAIVQFKLLSQSNPGNATVISVLQNLEAGRQPFASSTPPSPSVAPVSQ